MRQLKLLAVVIFILTFLAFVAGILWFEAKGTLFSISPLFYWFIVIGWAFFVIKLKLRSKQTFKLALGLYIVAALLTVLGLRQNGIAEVIMRLSYVNLVLGLTQTIVEYKHV